MAHTRILTDALGALENLDKAVRLRSAGDSFDLVLRLDDDRGSVAAVLARDICRKNHDPNARRAALDRLGSADGAVGQNPLLGFATMDITTKATVRDLAMLARSLVFRSWAEMRRAVMTFDILHHSFTIEAPRDGLVPEPGRRGSDDGSIVIWAPDEPVECLYIVLTAAAQTGRLVRLVCRGGDLANIPAEIVATEDGARALSHASMCVAASLSDPGPAIALARWGIPLCATFTSGAHEWLDGVCSYRSWSVSSAAAAFAFALAAPVARFEPSSPLHIGATEIPNHDVLVTVVVRTRGAGISDATAASISRQCHRAYETIAASTAQELREALGSAKGTYIVFLQDGDILFREGLAALVGVLENSHAELAYGDGLLGYVIDAPGTPTVLGYSVLERMPVWARTMAAHDEFVGAYFRVLFRRASLVEVGLDEDLDGLMIYDAFLHMLMRSTAVRADEVCGMSYRYLDGRSPGAANIRYAQEYERVYARFPAADSVVADARAAVREHLRSHDGIGLRPPPQRLHPPRPV